MAKNSAKDKYLRWRCSKYRKQYDNHCVREKKYLLSLGDIGYKTDKCGIPLKPKQEDEKYILYGKDGNVLYEHFKSKHLKNNSCVMRNDLLFEEDLKLYKKDIEKYLKEKQPYTKSCANCKHCLYRTSNKQNESFFDRPQHYVYCKLRNEEIKVECLSSRLGYELEFYTCKKWELDKNKTFKPCTFLFVTTPLYDYDIHKRKVKKGAIKIVTDHMLYRHENSEQSFYKDFMTGWREGCRQKWIVVETTDFKTFKECEEYRKKNRYKLREKADNLIINYLWECE